MNAMVRTLLSLALVAALTLSGNADDPGKSIRIWRDQTGKFEVEAELLEVKDGRVKLRKADGRVIYPPLSLLSLVDQDYISKWEEQQQDGNIFAGGVMERGVADPAAADQESAASKPGRRLPSWRVGAQPVTFTPGDLLVFQPMKRPKLTEPTALSVSESRDDEKIIMVPSMKGYPDGSVPLLIDDRTKRVFFRLQQGTWDKEKFTQAVLVDPRTNRATPTTRWDETLVFVNSHAASGRVIARAKTGSWGATGELAVFSTSSSGSFRELVRFKPSSEDPKASPRVAHVHFVDDHLVTARAGDTIHLWDLATRRELWRLRIGGWHRAARTRDNRYLAAQSQNEIAIFEMASGRQIGLLALPNPDAVDLAFSPSGLKLAAVGGRLIRVFDLQDESKDSVTELTNKIDTFHSDPVWADEDHLIVADSLLVDTQLGYLIWTYAMGNRATISSTFKTGLMRGTIAGRGGIAVFALAVPHEAALKAKKATHFGDAVRIKRGASVRIEMDLAESTEPEKVKSLLTKAIEKAGWIISDSAPHTVRFQNYRTTEKKQTFGSGQFKGQELPFRPYASVLEIVADGVPVYRLVDSGRAPNEMDIGLDETLKQAIERQTVPSYRLLERLELPTQIIAPDLQSGLGKSSLTAAGFVDDRDFQWALADLPPRG